MKKIFRVLSLSAFMFSCAASTSYGDVLVLNIDSKKLAEKPELKGAIDKEKADLMVKTKEYNALGDEIKAMDAEIASAPEDKKVDIVKKRDAKVKELEKKIETLKTHINAVQAKLKGMQNSMILEHIKKKYPKRIKDPIVVCDSETESLVAMYNIPKLAI